MQREINRQKNNERRTRAQKFKRWITIERQTVAKKIDRETDDKHVETWIQCNSFETREQSATSKCVCV
jgi:hypothetical protein